MNASTPRTPAEAFVRSISEQVYRITLSQSAGGLDPAWRLATYDRMVEKDGDGGKRQSGRAAAYDKLTRTYLEVLKIPLPEGE